jgi:hypothetical protein
MGSEAFKETVFAADTGTITVRGGYGRNTVYLGLAEGNDPEGQPEILIAMTPLQTRKLGEELGVMTAGALDNALDALRDMAEIAMHALDQIEDRTRDAKAASVAKEAFDAVDSIRASALGGD